MSNGNVVMINDSWFMIMIMMISNDRTMNDS